MQVRVSARRIAGRTLTWNQLPKVYEGTLLSTRKGADDRMVVTLLLSGHEGDGPHLYEPRVTSVLGNEIRIIGLERVDLAWVFQEWNCEILSVR